MKRTCLRYQGMKQRTPHTPATVQITTLEIAGMSCAGCARKMTTALNALEGVVHAKVDLQTDRAIVEHLPAYTDAPTLVATVRDAGYLGRIANTVYGTEPAPSQAGATGGCSCGCGPSRSPGSFDLGTSTIG